ncbi:MAG: hypothetical protein ACRDS1_09205 [Pseudonocardiaceae bacterium]
MTASVWCSAEVGIAQSRGSLVLPVQDEPGVTHPLLTQIQQTIQPTVATNRTEEVMLAPA